MDRYSRYRIVIIILLSAVILEGIFIIRLKPVKKEKPAMPVKGRIAIVIDDWGYNLNNLPFLDEIRYPLNISILPHLAHSKEIASKARTRGHELILHLPLEPKAAEVNDYAGLEKNTIMTNMNPEQIKEILLKAMDSVPYVKGVSNHMGSRATADYKTMQAIFQELKKKNLYFLDSVVTPDSICFEVAKELSVRFAERDIFLDNELVRDYIRRQIEILKLKAMKNGQAIGVGHDRKVTLQVLKEIMPQLEKEGYKLVFVSDLAD